MRIRTFIAVAATAEVRHSAERLMGRLRLSVSDVKWVEPENLHWTLQFLGEVEQLEIPAVCNAVATAASDMEAFDLEARGAGAFPAPDRPRTLWIGAGRGAQTLVALQAAIDKNLKRLGYRSEQRRFVPHLTIGRAGRDTHSNALMRELTAVADYDAGSMLVDEVVVYASKLRSEGPRYEPLARAPLI